MAWTSKLKATARRAIPGLATFEGYRLAWLRHDLVSALTVSAMFVPQGLAYAQLAGVEPSKGLWAGVAGMLTYFFVGSSPHIVIGPEAGASIITAAALLPLAGGDPQRYALLAIVLALLLGVINLAGGLFKAGGLADFLSKPILVGYVNGAALIIIGSQIARLLGLERREQQFGYQIVEVVRNFAQAHWPTIVLSLAVIAGLVLLKTFLPRIPGALLAVVITTVAATLFQWQREGIELIGPIPSQFPPVGLPSFGYRDVLAVLPGAFSLALVNYASAVLTARIYADRGGYRVDANQEFFGQAVPNLAAALVQTFPVTASDSRSAINFSSGARTRLAGLLAGVFTLLVALFLASALANLPRAALAAVVTVAGVYLLDFGTVRRLWRERRAEAVLALVTTVGILTFGILRGILFAVALALGDLIRRAARPHDAVLGEIEGKPGFHDIERQQESQTIPGLIIYRVDAPLFFANARFLRERVRELIEDAGSPTLWFCLDASAVFDLDVTAAESLEKIHHELEARGMRLVLARAKGPLRDELRRYGLAELIGEDYLFARVGTAVEAFLQEYPDRRPPPGSSADAARGLE